MFMPDQYFENHLIHEKSPYLLQHAHNPVDWHPWGEEAFNLSKLKDKPIFLSIGYVTCHWCHVMSKESFNNPEIATMMNDVFVSIKVDKEELPEVDNLYMEFAQTLTSSAAGWPLNIILTPGLKPFYAATYMPPNAKEGIIGLKELTSHIKELWNSEEREHLFDQAEKLVNLFKSSALTRGKELPTKNLVDEALEVLFEGADPIYGGIGMTPKFPMGYQSQFFLNHAKMYNDARSLFFVETTLNMMARGGIHDQVGGGFSRYSIDEKWTIPHFEKMLYDNAFVGEAYLNAWRMTKKEKYKRVAQRTFDYVLREMRDDRGGFCSAEDADGDGITGAFYLWSKEEIIATLPQEDYPLFCEFFTITHEGNFDGKNILHSLVSLEEFAQYKNISLQNLEKRFNKCLDLLLKKRSQRTRPFKDDKILVSWNAFMINAYVKASLALRDEKYMNAALDAVRFIRKHLWKDGELLRRFREGDSDFKGTLNDYSSLIRALITLYESGQGQEWLDWAIEMTALLERRFKSERGAFYLTDSDHSILLRRCEFYDSSQPSGNSIHAENLLRLHLITHNHEYKIQAEDVLKVAKDYIEAFPQGATYHLFSLLCYLDTDALTFIIALDKKGTFKHEISNLLYKQFIPNATIIWADKCEYVPLEGKTTLYICKKGNCLMSLSNWEAIEKAILDEKWQT